MIPWTNEAIKKVLTLITPYAIEHVYEGGNVTPRPQLVNLNSKRMRSYASAVNNRPQEGKRNVKRENPNEGEQEGYSVKKKEQVKEDLIAKLQTQLEDLKR